MAADPEEHEKNARMAEGGGRIKSAGAEKPVGVHDAENDDDSEEEEDEEPKLKYARLTRNLGAVYRNGDATSGFIVAGDKMILGTHNGNIHVFSIPTFQPLRQYRAHSASVTAVSISPFPPPLSAARPDFLRRRSSDAPGTPTKPPSVKSVSTASPRTPKHPPVPATPSNSIYIATSSIDGHVCVSSLVDMKDVTLRNFARPVQAVALSPEYKSDRSYLSGGLAGNLILTTGGRTGVSSNANTSSAAAAASGWLGSIGLGPNTGRDTILHSGEGSISTIKWSLSGKFVVWVNEQGIKIMRSNIKLESADSDAAWKRIAHIDRPNRRGWEEMVGVWKARAEWINAGNLEPDDDEPPTSNGSHSTPDAGPQKETTPGKQPGRVAITALKKATEKLLVGWGDTAWIVHVNPGGTGVGKEVGERSVGSADIVHLLRFDDCIVSGLSLYTPSLLLVLAYRTRDDDDKPIDTTIQSAPRRGFHHRQNGLSPELRLVNASTGYEVDADTLTVNRFEALSAADYHLGTLYVPLVRTVEPAQRGALETIGGGIWDAGVSATRLFSSGASIISLPSSGDKHSVSHGSAGAGKASSIGTRAQEPHPAASSTGLKIFIQSPYDCVLAIKRDLSDHLNWLLERQKYRDAWELIDEHPDIVFSELPPDSSPILTPVKTQQSLVDFFADEDGTQATISAERATNSTAEKEKRRVGDLWLQQLVAARDWQLAGKVAGQVLGTSTRWEHWIWAFAQAGRFDEVSPYIPTQPLKPPLPPLCYEVVLGHYIINDRPRLKQLLDLWDSALFNVDSVVSAIEDKLRVGDVTEDSVEGGERGRDWRILSEGLAKLHLAEGRPKEALRCYIRIHNADAAMGLIRDYHLLGAVADDIPGFILLRVSKEQLKSPKTPLAELEEASSEAVQLLVEEAYQGIVRPGEVVEQLHSQRRDEFFRPFLFFYFRALWNGQGTETENGIQSDPDTSEGRVLVEDFGDLVVQLFAQYDRPLFMKFLRLSQSYSFEKAAEVCRTRNYIQELVYLLSKTGQMKEALFLIINEIKDVSQAIAFAKEQNDPDLWNDLLDYSMDKPVFIRGLLSEVGTAINPIALVRRIPEGLEIEGLRDGIGRMVREYEIQGSISEGVARVLRGEVVAGLERLREGRRRGVKFEVVSDGGEIEVHVQPVEPKDDATVVDVPLQEKKPARQEPQPGYCVGCHRAFREDEKETLIGFACGHVFHLPCLLTALSSADPTAASAAETLQSRLAAAADYDDGEYTARSVGAKVAHAHIIRNAIRGGCPVCAGRED